MRNRRNDEIEGGGMKMMNNCEDEDKDDEQFFFFSEFVGFNFNFWMKVQGERKIIMMCKKLGCVIFFFKFLVMCNFFKV